MKINKSKRDKEIERRYVIGSFSINQDITYHSKGRKLLVNNVLIRVQGEAEMTPRINLTATGWAIRARNVSVFLALQIPFQRFEDLTIDERVGKYG